MNNCTTCVALRSAKWLLALLVLGLCLSQAWAATELPELYGQDYVRLGQSWTDAHPPSLPTPPAEHGAADESAYLEQVQTREWSGGPYSDALAEPLSGLGRYYRDQGKYKEALGLFKRALHVVRVNDGLYSERQIPLVRDLLDTYRMAGEMKALDERYEYFFRLYGNGYPPYTELRLRASLEFLRWQREAFRLELDGRRNNRLVDMYRLNKRILESAAESPEVTPYWYGQLVLSQIRNLYLIQSKIMLFDDAFGVQSSSSIHTNSSIHSSSSIHSNQEQELDFTQRRLETIRRTSAAKGRSLLQELIARTAASGEAVELAAVHLELGDWQQWNGSNGGARKEYSAVIKILTDAGESQLLEQWLGSPAELPANGAFWQPERLAQNGRRVVLSAEYDVSARGKARNIHVRADKPEDTGLTARLHRKLSATRFRPRFASGEAQAVTRVSRQYELVVE